jgi:predicted NBD/HSP70 family sugar kinase
MDLPYAPARPRPPLRRADIRTVPHAAPRPERSGAVTGAVTANPSTAGRVLRAVLDHGPVARSTIARLTALSPATVSGQCAALLERGLLREAPEAAGPKGVGRPHVPLDVDTDRCVVGAAHISVPHATVALMDLRGRVLAEERRPHAGREPETVLASLAERLPRLLERHAPGRPVLGLGVATGGWVDPEAGTVVRHPMLGWRDVPVRDRLAAATGLPVHVDGHARALVRAERLFGASAVPSRASVVQLFVGNVVDAAFATGATVHEGPRSAAGAVAHLPVGTSDEPCVCGRVGCLQATVSERTMLRRALREGLVPPGSGFPALLEVALAGDPRALEMFRERARLLGRAVALLMDLLNPEVLAIAEPGVSRLPGCLDDLRAEVRRHSWVCDDPERAVVGTSFPGQVLPVAGGAVMLDAVYGDPLAPPPSLSRAS